MKLSEEQFKMFISNRLDIKVNKYHNKKVKYDGYTFDSKKEGLFYLKLKTMEELGLIKDLELQPKFLLIDTIHYKGKTYPKTYYISDFKYVDSNTGKIKVIDIKSKITVKDKTYRLKIKMLLSKYPEIDFDEVI